MGGVFPRVHEEVTGQPQMLFSMCALPCVLRQGLTLGLEHLYSSWLSGQQAPGICLLPSPQCWDYKHYPYARFYVDSRGLELRSFCLHNEHFTGIISPEPKSQ